MWSDEKEPVKKAGWIVMAALCIVAALGVIWARPRGSVPSEPTARMAPAPSAEPTHSEPAPTATPAPRAAEASDDALQLTHNGDLIITPEVRHYFDRYLDAEGAPSVQSVRSTIQANLYRRLPSYSARQAADLLDRYLKYRHQAADLPKDGSEQARLTRDWELRRKLIGPDDARQLFSDQPQPAQKAAPASPDVPESSSARTL
jgi:hypothetical protein